MKVVSLSIRLLIFFSLEVISLGEKGHSLSSPEWSRLVPLTLEEEELYEILHQVDVLSDGTGEDQTKAYHLLKKELQLVRI